MNRNLYLRLHAQKNNIKQQNEIDEKNSYIRSYDEIYKDIGKFKKLKVAIIDVCNQDIGIKILFPEADYYVFEKRLGNDLICEQYKINILENEKINNINDKNYDSLFVVVSMYNAIKYIEKDKINHEYLENISEYFFKISKIINNNNFINICFFLNCDLNYEPNIIFNHYQFTEDSRKKILFFKRNFGKDITYESNVFSFPYLIFNNNNYNIIDSLINSRKELSVEKDNHLFFSGAIYTTQNSHDGIIRDRRGIIEKIVEKFKDINNKKSVKVFIPDKKPHFEYLNNIQKSKYCLDVIGAGDPNLRTFEILHCGSLLISQRTSLVWNSPEVFFLEETIFDDENDLYEKINRLNMDDNLYAKCLKWQNYIIKIYMNLEYLRSYIQDKII
jgi:hypothetical protein